MTFPYQITVAHLRDLKKQAPTAVCEESPGTTNRHIIINRTVPPFDNADVRRAMALAIDRQAFIDILSEGKGSVGGVLQPQPGGLWGVPHERLKELPGYGTDIQKNRQEARAILERLGYGPQKRLKFKLMTRDLASYRDAAVILLDQLKEVGLDAELDVVETGAYFPKLRRKDFVVGLNVQTSGPDPDQVLEPFYGCGASLNWDGYCSAEVDKLIAAQSREAVEAKRRELHWQIEKKLAEDGARPIINYSHAATCWQPHVKGHTVMVNSIFNGYRFENIWLDK